MIKSFRDLEVYQESYQLMLIIHAAVKKPPVFEHNDLASQMRWSRILRWQKIWVIG